MESGSKKYQWTKEGFLVTKKPVVSVFGTTKSWFILTDHCLQRKSSLNSDVEAEYPIDQSCKIERGSKTAHEFIISCQKTTLKLYAESEIDRNDWIIAIATRLRQAGVPLDALYNLNLSKKLLSEAGYRLDGVSTPTLTPITSDDARDNSGPVVPFKALAYDIGSGSLDLSLKRATNVAEEKTKSGAGDAGDAGVRTDPAMELGVVLVTQDEVTSRSEVGPWAVPKTRLENQPDTGEAQTETTDEAIPDIWRKEGFLGTKRSTLTKTVTTKSWFILTSTTLRRQAQQNSVVEGEYPIDCSCRIEKGQKLFEIIFYCRDTKLKLYPESERDQMDWLIAIATMLRHAGVPCSNLKLAQEDLFAAGYSQIKPSGDELPPTPAPEVVVGSGKAWRQSVGVVTPIGVVESVTQGAVAQDVAREGARGDNKHKTEPGTEDSRFKAETAPQMLAAVQVKDAAEGDAAPRPRDEIKSESQDEGQDGYEYGGHSGVQQAVKGKAGPGVRPGAGLDLRSGAGDEIAAEPEDAAEDSARHTAMDPAVLMGSHGGSAEEKAGDLNRTNHCTVVSGKLIDGKQTLRPATGLDPKIWSHHFATINELESIQSGVSATAIITKEGGSTTGEAKDEGKKNEQLGATDRTVSPVDSACTFYPAWRIRVLPTEPHYRRDGWMCWRDRDDRYLLHLSFRHADGASFLVIKSTVREGVGWEAGVGSTVAETDTLRLRDASGPLDLTVTVTEAGFSVRVAERAAPATSATSATQIPPATPATSATQISQASVMFRHRAPWRTFNNVALHENWTCIRLTDEQVCWMDKEVEWRVQEAVADLHRERERWSQPLQTKRRGLKAVSFFVALVVLMAIAMSDSKGYYYLPPAAVYAYAMSQAGLSFTALTSFLKAKGYSAMELKVVGYPASAVRQAGYTAEMMKDARYSIGELTTGRSPAGFTVRELSDGRFPLQELKAAGILAADFKEAHFTASELTAAYSVEELREGGFSAADLKGAFPIAELKAAGVSVADFKTANFSISELTAAYTVEELRKGGFSAADLKGAFPIAELKTAGVSVADFKTANFSISELTASYSVAELKGGGFTAVDMFDFFKGSELKAVGFSAKELAEALFCVEEMLEAEFTIAELWAEGYSAQEMREAGVSAAVLLAEGYTANDLVGGGFHQDDIPH